MNPQDVTNWTHWTWWSRQPAPPWTPGRSRLRTSFPCGASGNACARRSRPASTCDHGRRWFSPRRERWGFPRFAWEEGRKTFQYFKREASDVKKPHLNKKTAKKKLLNPLDDSILHVDVGAEGLIIVDDLSSFDQETVTLEPNRED